MGTAVFQCPKIRGRLPAAPECNAFTGRAISFRPRAPRQTHGSVVFDQPAVVERAQELLRASGIADRCRLVGGSFFDSVPARGDAYILNHIIHDWEDGDATRILQVVRRAISDDGAVLLIEADLGPPNDTPAAKFADLNPGFARRARAHAR
jgi:hypothetical protein